MDESDLSQFKEVFVPEAREYLAALNTALVELEKNLANKDVLSDIFRVAHTLKGMAATMGFDKITHLTHKMEDVFDKLRKGEASAKGDTLDVLFECLDALSKLVDEIDTGAEAKSDVERLVARLAALIGEEGPAAPAAAEPEEPGAPPAPEEQAAGEERAEQADAAVQAGQDESASPDDNLAGSRPFEAPGGAGAKQDGIAPAAAAPEAEKKTKTTHVRINTSYLDVVMNLVGELVISKSQLEQISGRHKIDELTETLQEFDRIAIDLQEAVLKTRMVSVSQVFDRYPRMVRDLARKLEKDIEFEIYGADIGIDRLLLDEINEPLVHLLRNAIDHGVELPAAREKKGKLRKGKVTLGARRERGFILIEVSDDGKGLDPVLIQKKAVSLGMITEEQARTMSNEDTFGLICDSRFSTAETITDISGRGVGMDAVKTMIESFNGRLAIRSQKGAGSSFVLHLPLSLAIISALMVRVKNEIYAIPLNNITEIVPLSPDSVKSIGGNEVVVFRDRVIPLIRLDKKLGANTRAAARAESGTQYVLVFESGTKSAGMVVDNFLGRKEIVVKTLTGIVKRARGFSGATILGDGSVVLILDISLWI
ncbi:MAG: hypothetical protein A2X28_08605 [Elusimicrobia bacterium GWA2_56_46]|nr:MAG: hypothetical protein A2X28_08605 [Elusimicrobia bacterium GWA2_56_46]OGR55196.1 MAG: hypothetical protein A2X39_01510 [Elusimicrobia bacterium GWC2_56_31]HBB66282.1 chemotaxis protein CheA [Elusimicrobiota bacterium]HBW23730.1 chemotaxis protein CheA [Elusimicrobiota bacterium]